jgi:hypothetical protein
MIDDVMYETKKAFDKSKVEKSVCTSLKKFFEAKMTGSSWHAICGKHFGVSLTHATDHMIYFTIKEANVITKPLNILLFMSHEHVE